ncbi:MAG TPA: branched-chain amino acid ABC transporter permease [Thermodesulfobacteriota bacterium]
MSPALLAQGLVTGVLLGGVYALVALGLTLIFGVMRVINVAHGTLLMVGAYVTFTAANGLGMNPLASLLVSAPLLFLLGVLVQRFVVERVVGAPELQGLLVTFGVSIILINLALRVFKPDIRAVTYLSGSLTLGGVAFSVPRLIAFAVAVAATAAAMLFLKRSRLGKAIRATAQNQTVAVVCGVDVKRIRLVAFGLGAALAGVGGSLISIMYAIYPEMGSLYTLKAFCVVVLGGLGSYLGALLGGVILGLAESFTGLYVGTQAAEAVAYLLLVAVLLVRPQGLLGERRQ